MLAGLFSRRLMCAGILNQRIIIQQLAPNSPDQTPEGEPDNSWADVVSTWASVEPLSGRELLLAQQVMPEAQVRVRLRYRAGITATMRIAHGSDYYDILYIGNKGSGNRELELLCKTGVSNG